MEYVNLTAICEWQGANRYIKYQEPYILNVDDLNNLEICKNDETWTSMGGGEKVDARL